MFYINFHIVQKSNWQKQFIEKSCLYLFPNYFIFAFPLDNHFHWFLTVFLHANISKNKVCFYCQPFLTQKVAYHKHYGALFFFFLLLCTSFQTIQRTTSFSIQLYKTPLQGCPTVYLASALPILLFFLSFAILKKML